jgi:pyrroline-5-carboxylate reductase
VHSHKDQNEVPRLGILGAGRLGRAIANRWRTAQGRKPLLWSRRFEAGAAAAESAAGGSPYSVAWLESVMEADAVFAAIPSGGVAELASAHPAVRNFGGPLFITGIDLPADAVQRAVPEAMVVRVVPALLPARDDVPCLVLRPASGGARRIECVEAILKALGPAHYVEDERTYEVVMYLASPFPVVVRRAVGEAVAGILARRGIDERWQPVAERVMWEALSGMGPTPARGGTDAAEAEVATPGGVTAAGLAEAGRLSRVMVDTLLLMIDHGEQLRLDKERP